MRVTIACPHCSRKLKLDGEKLGATVACPLCGAEFAADPAAIDTPPRRERDLTGQEFAQRAGIDLGEAHDTGEPYAWHGVRARTARLQQQLPQVAPAYRPSGRMPASALGWLAAGALSGSLAGVVSAAAVAALAVAGVYVVRYAFLGGTSGSLGDVRHGYIGFLVILVLVVAGFVGAYYALGRVAALFTNMSGRRGKNRNTLAAVSFAAASATAGSVLGYFVLAVALDRLGVELRGYQEAELHGRLALSAALLGGLLAAVVAGWFGYRAVRAHKFCERCDRPMTERRLQAVGMGALRALARAVTERELRATADLLAMPAGDVGQPVLFHCPNCREGYLDVTATFLFAWIDKRGEVVQHRESWLAASARLDGDEMVLFAHLL